MTIKELAEKTHLSISTVSKALNNQKDVSEETRRLVLDAAKKFGYKTKEQKQIERDHHRFVVIHSNMGIVGTNSVLYPVTKSFTTEAKKYNTEVILYDITDDYDFDFNKFMKKGKYSGALILGVNSLHPVMKQLHDTKYPIVLHDNTIVNDLIGNIGTDNITSLISTINYLHQNGHTKIAFVAGEKSSYVATERCTGYLMGLRFNDLTYNPNLVYWGDFSKNTGIKAADFLDNKDFTAVVCSSDLIALGLMERFKELGYKIPEDISITGFDNFELSSDTNPKLTTIHQDFNKIGRDSYHLLTSLLLNKSPQRIILPGELIIRDSVKTIE